VWLCTARGGVTMDSPAHVEKGLNTTSYTTQTDGAGTFTLPGATGPEGIIIVHEQGYLEVSPIHSDALGRLLLLPWARVEGKVVLESQPAANERILAYNFVSRYSDSGRRFTWRSYHFETTTDSSGAFSFDKMPPGEWGFCRQTLAAGTGFESHDTHIRVDAGSVSKIVLGGAGRTVIGKLSLPGTTQGIDWRSVPVRFEMRNSQPITVRPRRAVFPSREAYVMAAEQFFGASRNWHRYGAFCDSTGAFRVQDVPPGTYDLQVRVRDLKPNSVDANEAGSPGPIPDIAVLRQEVILPEAGQSVEPLDLGMLEMLAAPGTASNP
jgi:hypothetical protein